MIIYTGIGSRETPENILLIFEELGKTLGEKGFLLRSGHAEGADISFENSCDISNGKKEIYLPWYRFNNSNSNYCNIPNKVFEFASTYFKYWENMKRSTQKLMARNCQQVLGFNLDIETNFIVCYTKEGKLLGGTSQALRIAKDKNIKVFNAGSYFDMNKFKNDVLDYSNLLLAGN